LVGQVIQVGEIENIEQSAQRYVLALTTTEHAPTWLDHGVSSDDVPNLGESYDSDRSSECSMQSGVLAWSPEVG